MKAKRSEQGQVLVLIILALVGIIGFAALAVDLGRVFSERRRAQNAADSAALAAAFSGAKVEVISNNVGPRRTAAQNAAVTQLQLNDYVDDHINQPDGHPVEIEVYVPPKNGPHLNDPDYYQVIIYQDVEKVFSHFIFGGLLEFTVEAVTNWKDEEPMFEGQALVALCPDCTPGLRFHGNAPIHITNGGAYSYSNRTGSGGLCNGVAGTGGNKTLISSTSLGSTTVIFDPGYTLTTRGRWRDSSDGTGGLFEEDGDPSNPDDPVSAIECQDIGLPLDLPAPICGAVVTDIPDPDSDGYINMEPGTYKFEVNDGEFKAGKKGGPLVKMKSGIYCFEKGFYVKKGIFTGDEVLFYVTGGDFSITSSAVANFEPWVDKKGAVYPDGTIDPTFQWAGMLIYMPKENVYGQIAITADANASYTGTVYAPGPYLKKPTNTPAEGFKCDIGGSSATQAVDSSIICYTIQVGGGATLNMNYNAEKNFNFAPSISLSK